jgi:hypothetical protein
MSGPYKLKYRPRPLHVLMYYTNPLNMVGDPYYKRDGDVWDKRCRAVYAAMIAEKRGETPEHQRTGLWMWQ